MGKLNGEQIEMLLGTWASIPIQGGRSLRPVKNRGRKNQQVYFSLDFLQSLLMHILTLASVCSVTIDVLLLCSQSTFYGFTACDQWVYGAVQIPTSLPHTCAVASRKTDRKFSWQCTMLEADFRLLLVKNSTPPKHVYR